VSHSFAARFGDDPELESLDEGRRVLVRVKEAIQVGVNESLPIRALLGPGRLDVRLLSLFKDFSEAGGFEGVPSLLDQWASVSGDIFPKLLGKVRGPAGGVPIEVMSLAKARDVVVHLITEFTEAHLLQLAKLMVEGVEDFILDFIHVGQKITHLSVVLDVHRGRGDQGSVTSMGVDVEYVHE
jgi:hypothetical protein